MLLYLSSLGHIARMRIAPAENRGGGLFFDISP